MPVAASTVAGAENIQLTGIEHDGANGLQASPLVHAEVVRVLRYSL